MKIKRQKTIMKVSAYFEAARRRMGYLCAGVYGIAIRTADELYLRVRHGKIEKEGREDVGLVTGTSSSSSPRKNNKIAPFCGNYILSLSPCSNFYIHTQTHIQLQILDNTTFHSYFPRH
jgi:hypothetical protein